MNSATPVSPAATTPDASLTLATSQTLAAEALDTLRSAQVDTARARDDIGRGSSIYSVVLGLLVITFMGWSVLSQVHQPAGVAPFIADAGFVRIGMWSLTLGVIISVATMIGPLCAGRATRSWLLNSPADRAVFLRGPLLVLAAALGAFGTVGGAFVEAVRGTPTPIAIAGSGAWFAIAFTVVILLAAGQGRPLVDATSRPLGLGLVGVGALALTLGVLPGWSVVAPLHTRPQGADRVQTILIAIAVVLCLVILVRARRHVRAATRRLRLHQLARGGDILDALGVSTLMLDSTRIRAVLAPGISSRRRVSHPVRRARGAWALAELDFYRIRRRGTGMLLTLALLPLPATSSAFFGPSGGVWVAALLGHLIVFGFASALTMWTRSPGIRRELPVSDWRARLALLACPLGLGTLWAAVALPLARVDVAYFPALLAAIAGAALRASETRDASAAGAVMVSGPMGVIPIGLVLLAIRGFDMLILPALLLTIGQSAAAFAVAAATFGYLLIRRPTL